MPSQIPLVDYLVLGDEPHLVAHECTSCGARYFDRRNACAACGGTDVHDRSTSPPRARCGPSPSWRSPRPASRCPFVAGGGRLRRHQRAGQRRSTSTPDPEHVTLGMKVRLATYSIGTDEDGTEAIGFGFEPA